MQKVKKVLVVNMFLFVLFIKIQNIVLVLMRKVDTTAKVVGQKGNAITFARAFGFNEKDYYSNDYQSTKKAVDRKAITAKKETINLNEKAKSYFKMLPMAMRRKFFGR